MSKRVLIFAAVILMVFAAKVVFALEYHPIETPEPVSTALFILGGATLAVRRLRRK